MRITDKPRMAGEHRQNGRWKAADAGIRPGRTRFLAPTAPLRPMPADPPTLAAPLRKTPACRQPRQAFP
jgi:hypothetical protein